VPDRSREMTLPRSVADVVSRHVLFEIESIDRMYCNLILSLRVRRSCDLRRPVVDSVADGTLAA
jgi:hypothetical protein